MAKNIRYDVEVAHEKHLKDDRLKNAQEIFAFLKENDVIPESIDDSSWSYKNNLFFIINDAWVHTNQWFMYGNLSTWEDYPITDEIKEILWANIRKCSGECGCPNWPRGGNPTVFGKTFESVCSSKFWFANPEGETLEDIKKLVKFAINNIDNATHP